MTPTAASEPPRRSEWGCLLWKTWLFGPASYASFLLYVRVRSWSGHPVEEAELGLAGFFVLLAHLYAAACTFLLLAARGRHRRSAEFKLLLVYWLGLAGAVLLPLLCLWVAADEIVPWIMVVCLVVSLVTAVVMPIVWLAKLVRGRAP